ncbi:MAG: hypothetical protein ACYCW6_00285 [Candidatus Xenobia bacterium]
MTYRRVMSRNHFAAGDYGDPPRFWQPLANILESGDVYPDVAAARRTELESKAGMAALLAGDLRRLEHDAVDEQAICQEIVRRTGIDADSVAAVLKEFFSI